jgi:hypothetical protein
MLQSILTNIGPGRSFVALTEAQIREASTHDALLNLIFSDLQLRLPDRRPHLDGYLERARRIPVGLRAMAATFELDVSLTLDDAAWHFSNWYHRGYTEETLWGLWELEAFEYAELFGRVYDIALTYWDKIGAALGTDNFGDWYHGSELEKATMPLTSRMWDLQEIDKGIFGCWTKYARQYPHRLIDASLRKAVEKGVG